MNIQTNELEGWIILEMDLPLAPPQAQPRHPDFLRRSEIRPRRLMKFFLGGLRQNIFGYKNSWIFHYLVLSLSWAKEQSKKVNIVDDVTDESGRRVDGYPRRRGTEKFPICLSTVAVSLPASLWRHARKMASIDWFTLERELLFLRRKDEIMLSVVLDACS